MLYLWAQKKVTKVFRDALGKTEVKCRQLATVFANYEDPLVSTVFGTAASLPYDVFMAGLVEMSEVKKGVKFPPCVELTPTDVRLWVNAKTLEEEVGFKRLYNHNSKGGQSPELDCLWQFENIFLIIEAKKPREFFRSGQPAKYVNIIKKYANAKQCTQPEIWVLLVGFGTNASWSLSDVDDAIIPNLLYIEWSRVAAYIKEKIGTISLPLYARSALGAANNILGMVNLREFEGFVWPPPGVNGDIDSQIFYVEWFKPRIFPMSADEPFDLAPTTPFLWLKKEGN